MPRQLTSIRLRPEVIKALDRIAKRERRTRNDVIELILDGEIIAPSDIKRELQELERKNGNDNA